MLQKCSAWNVLQVFFDDPEPESIGFSLREVSRRCGLAHTSTKKHLQTLGKEGLVEAKHVEKGSRTYPIYRSNRASEDFRHLKSIDMIFRIKSSGLVDELEERTMPNCVVLFGSAARGEDIRESDVDLYVQSEEKELDLSDYESFLKRPIKLHFKSDFSSYPSELKNNIVNGILLQGYLKAY